MPHPVVTQLRFTRSEFVRGIAGVTIEEARRRIKPMNCISWMVGHLADQEQTYWLTMAQGKTPFPELRQLVGYGRPASVPSIVEMWAAWDAITEAADLYLDTLTPELLTTHLKRKSGKPNRENIGTSLYRTIYHYWYHTGEVLAVRQLLGHSDLPDFVGDLGAKAPYRPEAGGS